MIFVFATGIVAEEGEPINEVTISGPLCKEPVYRRTPLGREICDVMLAVPRIFHRADYLPCILWGRTAQELSQCHVRDNVQIFGRLQSRPYTKLTEDGPMERVAYEISALTADILEQDIQDGT
jgi:single-stranded DNA-binding protein